MKFHLKINPREYFNECPMKTPDLYSFNYIKGLSIYVWAILQSLKTNGLANKTITLSRRDLFSSCHLICK